MIATIDTVKIRLDNLSVSNATHLLEYEDGTLQAPTRTVFVKCKERYTVEKLFSRVGLGDKVWKKELINEKDMIYALSVNENEGEIMRICRELYETGLCEFAEPSFLRFNLLHNTFFSSQWGLRNTGQYGGTYGMDINVFPAWEMTRGNNVRVAIIDNGVEPDHPDLQANVVNGFDTTIGGTGNNGASDDMDFHGTACAGIIGGIDNTIGIVGVAPNCVIVPIRAFEGDRADDMPLINGMNVAWSRANADVISCSWGMGSPSSTMTAEINRATTEGRGGRGCVVVFSTGNENKSSVNFPASLGNVLAVGAMSPCGERKSPSSCDGEAWGSNYGDALNVVAPGVLVATTDRVGTNGYNITKPLHLKRRNENSRGFHQQGLHGMV